MGRPAQSLSFLRCSQYNKVVLVFVSVAGPFELD